MRIVWREPPHTCFLPPLLEGALQYRCAKSPATATRCLTAQAFDPTVLEALYFVLALVDDDHEAKQSAELSKRMREAAPPRLPRMKARPHESPPRHA
jgi:hypothetical protein